MICYRTTAVGQLGHPHSARGPISLRESEERFRAISEATVDAIILTDAEGVIRYWNSAADRTFGYWAAEAMLR